jgi:hypothetical protein
VPRGLCPGPRTLVRNQSLDFLVMSSMSALDNAGVASTRCCRPPAGPSRTFDSRPQQRAGIGRTDRRTGCRQQPPGHLSKGTSLNERNLHSKRPFSFRVLIRSRRSRLDWAGWEVWSGLCTPVLIGDLNNALVAVMCPPWTHSLARLLHLHHGGVIGPSASVIGLSQNLS